MYWKFPTSTPLSPFSRSCTGSSRPVRLSHLFLVHKLQVLHDSRQALHQLAALREILEALQARPLEEHCAHLLYLPAGVVQVRAGHRPKLPLYRLHHH